MVWCVISRSESFMRTLIIVTSHDNPFHRFFCAPLHAFFRLTPPQHDCFLFLPISLWSIEHQTWLAGYFMVLILGLSVWGLRRGDRPVRLSWNVWLLTLVIAAWPWLIVLDGPRARLLPVLAVLTVVVWLFIVLNLNVATVARRREVTRLAEWTFPISDLVWFAFHQRRMGPKAGWLRFVPILSVLIALSAITISQRGTLAVSAHPTSSARGGLTPWGGVQLMPLAVRVFDPHQASCDEDGCWFAETVTDVAGLWRYDARSRHATPMVRVRDLRSFVVSGKWLYLYDGFEREVLKIDPETRRPVWRVRVHGNEAVELVGREEFIVAVASNGAVTGIDQDGRVHFERTLPWHAWYPQAVGEHRVALVSPDTLEVRIVGAEPSGDIVMPLPIPAERARWRSTPSADIPVIVGTTYAERPETLYVATSWGEILRYEFAAHQWRPSFRQPPGIGLIAADGRHQVLFVYHRVGGYLDLLDAASGQRLTRTTASVFGNALSVSPKLQRVILSARGPGGTSLPEPGGLYALEYGRPGKTIERSAGD